MFDVAQRLAGLRETQPFLRLYALVDGLQYRMQYDRPLKEDTGLFPLFKGTPDTALAHAGPWLVDAEVVGERVVTELAELERAAPAVTWLIAPQDLTGLSQLLQLQLDVQLPDERTALLRFWDPRVLASLATTLDPAALDQLIGLVVEWHLLHEGQRKWIWRQ